VSKGVKQVRVGKVEWRGRRYSWTKRSELTQLTNPQHTRALSSHTGGFLISALHLIPCMRIRLVCILALYGNFPEVFKFSGNCASERSRGERRETATDEPRKTKERKHKMKKEREIIYCTTLSSLWLFYEQVVGTGCRVVVGKHDDPVEVRV